MLNLNSNHTIPQYKVGLTREAQRISSRELLGFAGFDQSTAPDDAGPGLISLLPVPRLHPEFLNLPGQRIAPPDEEVRRLDLPAAGVCHDDADQGAF